MPVVEPRPHSRNHLIKKIDGQKITKTMAGNTPLGSCVVQKLMITIIIIIIIIITKYVMLSLIL